MSRVPTTGLIGDLLVLADADGGASDEIERHIYHLLFTTRIDRNLTTRA